MSWDNVNGLSGWGKDPRHGAVTRGKGPASIDAQGVRRSAFGVRRSACGVRRAACGVRRLAYDAYAFGVCVMRVCDACV